MGLVWSTSAGAGLAGSGNGPCVAVVAEAKVQKPPEVDGRNPETEGELVRFDTAEPDPSMIVRDQMGDTTVSKIRSGASDARSLLRHNVNTVG